ncbi:MAG TPA: MotA/TolQ/ExbB proton channel family protein [Saprospiraceae bacterium]|nr:MotA/TolQ/ExbB proton channel family protein [Saprospiraceae bacterium]HPI07520.1 MotA/TolQ/ExbB proton channel family protein [Saprospiraceae bacterium]
MNTIFAHQRAVNLAISIFSAIIFWLIMSQLGQLLAQTAMYGVFRIFGGEGVGFLKVVAYTAFIFGWLELREKQRSIRREEAGFSFGLLPQQEQLVLSPEDVQNIKLEAIALERKGFYYLIPNLIKKTATQFRNENDVSETMQALESNLQASKDLREGELETVRYIIQSIPMLGFIGTIIELTSSLRYIAEKDGLRLTREAMSSAFDATLVALVLTILLTYFYHQYIGYMDVFFARVRNYLMDHLIARIYTR